MSGGPGGTPSLLRDPENSDDPLGSVLVVGSFQGVLRLDVFRDHFSPPRKFCPTLKTKWTVRYRPRGLHSCDDRRLIGIGQYNVVTSSMVEVYDFDTSELLMKDNSHHSSTVYGFSWIPEDPGGRILFASGSRDGNVLLWQVVDHSVEPGPLLSFKDRSTVYVMTAQPRSVYVGGLLDRSRCLLREHDLEADLRVVREFAEGGHLSECFAVVAGHGVEDQTLVSGAWDHTCCVWDRRQSRCVQRAEFDDRLFSLYLDHDRNTVLIGFEKGNVVQCDLRMINSNASTVHFSPHESSYVYDIFRVTRSLFVSVCFDGTVALWNPTKGESRAVDSVVVSPRGPYGMALVGGIDEDDQDVLSLVDWEEKSEYMQSLKLTKGCVKIVAFRGEIAVVLGKGLLVKVMCLELEPQ